MTSNEEFAIKLELINQKNPRLKYEASVYNFLAGSIGVPFVHSFGTTEHYNFMVLDLLGPNLEDLFKYCNHKFSLKTTLLLADQLINLIEDLHSQSMFYRLSPENLVVGTGKLGNLLYVIKFGHARHQTLSHDLWRDDKIPTGIAYDMSIDAPLEISTCYIQIPTST